MIQDRSFQAERFEVIDSEGRVRAILGMSEESEGGPYLRLLTHNGKPSVTVELNQKHTMGQIIECPSIEVYDKDEKVRINMSLSYSDPQYPGIGLNDSEGSRLIGMVVTPNDDAEISITDSDNNLLWIERGESEAVGEWITRVEQKVDHLYQELGVRAPTISERIGLLLKGRKRLEAIKLYAHEMNVTVPEAKKYIESRKDEGLDS